jgi:hypothetical protein
LRRFLEAILAVLVAALVLVSTAGALSFRLAPGSPHYAGTGAQSLAAADFNRDGQLDLVAVDSSQDDVSVLLGKGGGAFQRRRVYEVGRNPSSVAVGDFNRDGKPDLAVTTDHGVWVLLGNGRGGFTKAPGSPITVRASMVRVGDFNRDGKLDLVTVYLNITGTGTGSVLLGNGQGGFSPASGSPFKAVSWPIGMAVADFNGDGKLDLALADHRSDSVSLLLGNGQGGLTQAGSPVPVHGPPESMAMGDFNRDGHPDFAVPCNFTKTVSVLLGNGHGGLHPASGSPFKVGPNLGQVAVADFNGDGKLDLAIARANGPGQVFIMEGNGKGGFRAAKGSPFSGPAAVSSLVVKDFNRDGRPDLAATTYGGVSVLLNK